MSKKFNTTKLLNNSQVSLVKEIISRVVSQCPLPVTHAKGEGRGSAGSYVHDIFPSSVENYKRDNTHTEINEYGRVIASPRDHTDSQARSSNRPDAGRDGRNRNNAHNFAGNDTNRPAVVDDIRVIPRSGMAESCL